MRQSSTSWTNRVALLVLFSGACALLYQLAWLRELRLVFGSSTPASATVLAVFMGGLGAGSLVLGKLADKAERPLLLYAKLEAGIAISAASTPLLLGGARAGYIAMGGTVALGMGFGTVVRLLLSALVLLPPTFMMGGTLPAAARAAVPAGDAGRRSTALLYGVNTLGAVVGAGLTTFVMFESLGIRRTLWLGALANSLVAAVAWHFGKSSAALPVADNPTRKSTKRSRRSKAKSSKPKRAKPKRAKSPEPLPVRFVLAAAAAVGFVFLLLELVWYRMLGPLLGGTTYTFGLILAVALLGVGLGGVTYAMRNKRQPTLRSLALTCGLQALAVAVPFAIGDWIALLTLVLRDLSTFGLLGQAAGWTVITTIVVLPAALVAGYQFPLLIALLGSGREQLGRHVGLAYAANTLGAILGSLAGGFLLLPVATATGAWQLGACLLVVLAIVAIALDRPWNRRLMVAPAMTALLALSLVLWPEGPTEFWRHSPIGAGRADDVLHKASRNGLRSWVHERRRGLTWQADGRESSVGLMSVQETFFVINGKSDGSATLDAGTQVMSGLLGAMLHGKVERALVIGLGTGSTAGWLASVPSIEAVDVVELEPVMVDVARTFAPVNRGAVDHHKVNITVADAREVLLTSSQSYDLIFSEPSNPYRAGIASLFTQEFYAAVRKRLRSGGVFTQWVQVYEIDASSLRTVYNTLSTVFPSVQSWQMDGGDLLLVCGEKRQPPDLARLRKVITEEPFRKGLMSAWRVDSIEGVLAHHVAAPELAQAIAEHDGAARVNTDDRNLLEFGVARAVGREQALSIDALRRVATSRGEALPELSAAPGTAPVDVARLVDAYVSMGIALHSSAPRPLGIPGVANERGQQHAERMQRYQAQLAWSQGNPRAALIAWAGQPRAPRNAVELMVVADAYAAAGDDAALPLLDKLQAVQPTEAAVIRAKLRWHQRQPDLARDALRNAIIGYRTDPWPSHYLMIRTLPIAVEVARQSSSAAKELFDLLSEPFSVDALRAAREGLRFEIAMLFVHEQPALCVEALRAFEPHIPWNASFLEGRAKCYARAAHELAETAKEDLASFRADEGGDFAVGL